jgi:DNA-binding GntR family transcriptional regulator
VRGTSALRLRAGESRLPLGQAVTDELRRAILSGRYQPGERLIEDRLSEELGISRVPVREALRQLAGDGLVEVRPNRGATVANVSNDTARDLIEVRATLEGLNAKLAARNCRAATVDELRSVLAAGDHAALKGRVDDLVRMNGEFHDKLAEAGRNTILWDIMRSLRDRTELVFARQTASRAVQDWSEHARILAAVIDGDEELAALLATRHVHQAAEAAFSAAAAATTAASAAVPT